MWKRAAETFGVALLIVAGAFYFWSERISDPTWLRSGTKIEIRATAGAVAIVGSETKDVEVTIDGRSVRLTGQTATAIMAHARPGAPGPGCVIECRGRTRGNGPGD